MMRLLQRRTALLRLACSAAWILIGAAAVRGVSARADTLNGAVLINWNPNFLYGGPSYVPGLYYWNNDSGDGTKANIGWCLVGSSQCTLQNTPGRISFYATPFLTAPTNMYFTSSGQALQLTLDLSLTDEKGSGSGTDFFGYYLTDGTGIKISNSTIIFNSNQAVGTTAVLPSLPAGQNYGFFIENIQGYGTSPQQTTYDFYMNSSANSATGYMPTDQLQHFSIFQNGATYYLGTVDAASCSANFTVTSSPCISSSQFDYNDMVVQVSNLTSRSDVVTAVPEPGGLVVAGIILVALAGRRRFSTALR
ncbi:MAG TPA: PEP-CTERM sorting domain-containing protein [Bryobacteraceae bacterium]|nr:PEP-CTERM sorting domain-containing protein [Bryobacteraceae bacterium]